MKGKKFKKTASLIVNRESPTGNGYEVHNEGNPEDHWVIPKDVFYATYTVEKQDFGWAIEQLKAGHKVARKGWNGRGIFLELQRPDEFSKMTHPYIYIDTTGLQTTNEDAPKDRVPWLASQTDMLSEDWVIVK